MKTFFIGIILAAAMLTACSPEDEKQGQNITFESIAPQLLSDSSVQLTATASSGLPVFFSSDNPHVATIEDDRAVFHSAGQTKIYAAQQGNSQYYEAQSVFQLLTVRDWDPNKKNQTITFDLPQQWQISRDGQWLKLDAAASSGLPVTYTVKGETIGRLSGNEFYIYHGNESNNVFKDRYETTITIVAAQSGNDEYNYADNVEREIYIIGDVVH